MSVNARQFNNGILNMIEIHSYDFYIVQRDLEKACTCVGVATDQAAVDCPKCLGTGYKIKITKTRGAAQDTKLPSTFRGDQFLIARNYFVPNAHAVLKDDDLIVDDQDVYLVFEHQKMLAIKGQMPYNKYSSIKKKFDSKAFFKNFNKIVNRG